jgi:hypothetical protein
MVWLGKITRVEHRLTHVFRIVFTDRTRKDG